MQTTIQTPSGPEQVDVFHDEGGLAVTRALGFKEAVRRYVITHKASGSAVGEEVLGASRITRTYKNMRGAREGLRALLPLTDWTRPASEIAHYSLEATRALAELAQDAYTLKFLPPKP